MKPKILITRKFPQEMIDNLSKFCDIEYNLHDRPMLKKELIACIKDKHGLISMLNDLIDKEVIENAQNLRIISQMAVGYDNIDINVATQKGIIISNTPDILTDSTADLTFALILSIARRIIEGDKIVRNKKFKFWSPFSFLGNQVSGKVIGIIGMGRIGQAVAQRAYGFNMKILYFNNRKINSNLEKKYKAQFVQLNELLSLSDFITLHIPLTDKTKYLLTKNEFNIMKKSAYLINTSRGPIINEKDLVKALSDQVIAGVGLDVYENEPCVEAKLKDFNNVVLLPHIGSATTETRLRMAEMAIESLKIVLIKNKIPPRIIK